MLRINIADPNAMAQVILLNGSSSAGKTTLAVTLQQMLPEPYQYIGLDQYRDGMPERVRGLNAPSGTEGSRGLNVIPRPNNQTAIVFGDYGDKVLNNMRQSAALFAASGIPVIVDDLLLKRSYVDDYLDAFDVDQSWVVGVRCSMDVVAQRESARPGRFPGTAAEHFHRVHDFVDDYDIEVDTSSTPPQMLAQQIIDRMQTPPDCLKNLQNSRWSGGKGQ